MKSADHVGFITHKGKQILLVDFTNCTPEEVKSVADKARRIITAQPPNSVLVLADFTGAQFSRDAVTRIKGGDDLRPSLCEAGGVGAYGGPAQGLLRCHQGVFPARVPDIRDMRAGAGVLGGRLGRRFPNLRLHGGRIERV